MRKSKFTVSLIVLLFKTKHLTGSIPWVLKNNL